MFLESSLNHINDKNSSQSELIISLNSISRCCKCLSNDNLCWFHSESVKTSLISDAHNQITELTAIN